MDKVALGQVFSEYFGFPCQFSFHRLLDTHHLSSGAGTIGQIGNTTLGFCIVWQQVNSKNNVGHSPLVKLKSGIIRDGLPTSFKEPG
jgi:hypothetical protein